MRETPILHPLSDEISRTEVSSHREHWKAIYETLNDMKEGEDISFEKLLEDLGVNEEQYILAIRSSIQTPAVFLQRNPNELRINNYNKACLAAWRANMDIQFVLDVYACAVC